jgi:hypothetical protein
MNVLLEWRSTRTADNARCLLNLSKSREHVEACNQTSADINPAMATTISNYLRVNC